MRKKKTLHDSVNYSLDIFCKLTISIQYFIHPQHLSVRDIFDKTVRQSLFHRSQMRGNTLTNIQWSVCRYSADKTLESLSKKAPKKKQSLPAGTIHIFTLGGGTDSKGVNTIWCSLCNPWCTPPCTWIRATALQRIIWKSTWHIKDRTLPCREGCSLITELTYNIFLMNYCERRVGKQCLE